MQQVTTEEVLYEAWQSGGPYKVATMKQLLGISGGSASINETSSYPPEWYTPPTEMEVINP